MIGTGVEHILSSPTHTCRVINPAPPHKGIYRLTIMVFGIREAIRCQYGGDDLAPPFDRLDPVISGPFAAIALLD
jgi:hypothetical protein